MTSPRQGEGGNTSWQRFCGGFYGSWVGCSPGLAEFWRVKLLSIQGEEVSTKGVVTLCSGVFLVRCCDPADVLVQGPPSCQGDVNVPCINQLHGMRHSVSLGGRGNAAVSKGL